MPQQCVHIESAATEVCCRTRWIKRVLQSLEACKISSGAQAHARGVSCVRLGCPKDVPVCAR